MCLLDGIYILVSLQSPTLTNVKKSIHIIIIVRCWKNLKTFWFLDNIHKLYYQDAGFIAKKKETIRTKSCKNK